MKKGDKKVKCGQQKEEKCLKRGYEPTEIRISGQQLM